MGISNHFIHKEHPNKEYIWILSKASQSPKKLQALAEELAETFIYDRCTPKLATAWDDKRMGKSSLSDTMRQSLNAFIQPSFGIPSDKRGDDHVQGAVSEHLWYYLQKASGKNCIHVERPDLNPTSGGGDSIAVYRSSGGLSFRLWEIKKTISNPKSAVTRACTQLRNRGAQYLAEMTTINQEHPDRDIADLFSRLPTLWIDSSPEASVGISVATSTAKISYNCFDTLPKNFPGLGQRTSLMGMLKAVGDYPGFVRSVQKEIWRGL